MHQRHDSALAVGEYRESPIGDHTLPKAADSGL
jgi:hypothetical protein